MAIKRYAVLLYLITQTVAVIGVLYWIVAVRPCSYAEDCRADEETLPSSCMEGVPANQSQFTSQWNHEKGYLATLEYGGQQGASVLSILNQQCFAGAGFNILEPVMAVSKFTATAQIENYAVPFSDLIDLSHFNNVSANLGYSKLLLRETFFQKAPKKIVFVELVKSATRNLKVINTVWKTQTNCSCCHTEGVVTKYRLLSRLLEKGFCVVGIVTIQFRLNSCVFTERELRNVIFGKWAISEVTVVFSRWRYPWTVPSESFPSCDLDKLSNIRQYVEPSRKIIEDAKAYKRMWGSGSRTAVAVMFRFERLALRTCSKDTRAKSIACINFCINQALETTKELQATKAESNVFITMDIGNYGTVTMKNDFNFISIGERIIQTLQNSTLTFEEWEEKFTAISIHKGYIAAVQRYIASEADCLVLVGGGFFQEMALNDYISKHSNKRFRCTRFVCTMNTDVLKETVDI